MPVTGLKPGVTVRVNEQGGTRFSLQGGPLLFKLFLIAQFFSLTRYFFVVNFDENLASVATAVGVGSLALLPFVVLDYVLYLGNLWGFLQRSARVWLGLIFTTVLLLSFYGLSQGYSINAVTLDAGPYLILIACVILGSIPECWDKLFPMFLTLTLLAVVINLLGLQDFDELLQGDYQRRVIAELTAYETRAALEFWPLLLMTAPRWSRRTGSLIFLVAAFMLVLQILFQKRLFAVEVGSYFFLFWFIRPHFAQRWQSLAQAASERALRSRLLLMTLMVVTIGLITVPRVIEGQFQGLLDRYGEENSVRTDEAFGMLAYLQGHEYLVGRGMGGYFQYTDQKGREWGTYLEDVGMVRFQTHVGALMPMLKGGLIFSAIYYTGLALVWRERRRCLDDALSFAALMIVLVKTIASLQSGYLLMSATFETVLFGLSMGRILSNNASAPATSEAA